MFTEIDKEELNASANSSNNICKTLIVCGYPPSKRTGAAGAAIILWNLFSFYPLDKLYVLTSKLSIDVSRGQTDALLNCQHIEIKTTPLERLTYLFNDFNLFLIPMIMFKIMRVMKKFQIRAIFAPYPSSGEFFIAAYLVSRLTKYPLHVYIMDDPISQRFYSLNQLFVRLIFNRILYYAKKVWVIGKSMAEEYERRYNIKCETLHYSIDLNEFNSEMIEDSSLEKLDKNEWNIVYIGSMYHAQLDAMLNLVRILNDNDQTLMSGVNLHFYARNSEESLAKLGIQGKRIWIHPCVDLNIIPKILRNAHILFLPFSFKSEQRGIVSTSLPTKFSEYLASGVPILVHAPPYATVSKFSRQYDCALVVESSDRQKLHEAIAFLLKDSRIREKLSRNAKSAAREFFNAEKTKEKFLREFLTRTKDLGYQ